MNEWMNYSQIVWGSSNIPKEDIKNNEIKDAAKFVEERGEGERSQKVCRYIVIKSFKNAILR